MRKLQIVFFLFIMVFIASSAFTQSFHHYEDFGSLQYCNTIYNTADWNYIDSLGAPGRIPPKDVAHPAAGGKTIDVATNGKYIFTAASNSGGAGGGLYIHNAETYAPINSYVTSANEQGVCVHGSYAYTVSDNGVITKVDCGDVSAVLTATSNSDLSPTELKAIGAAGGYLYIAAGTNGVYVKNGLSGGATGIATTNAQDIAIYGSYMFVADGDGGFRVFSLQNPSLPSEVAGSPLATVSDCRGINISGYYAFVAAGDSLYIIDVSNPEAPSVFTRMGTAGNCYSACENSGKVYAACGEKGTMVFIGNSFDSLRSIGNTENYSTGKATSTVSVGHYAVVSDSNGGRIQYLSTGATLQPEASWDGTALDLGDHPLDMVVLGDYAYVSVQTVGLVTVDLVSGTITYINDAGAGNAALGVAQHGNMILVAMGAAGLRCFSIATDPAHPTELWTQPISGARAWCVSAEGNYAYVGAGYAPYGIYKIAILGDHTPSSVALASPVMDIDVSGDIIYAAAGYSGVLAYNLNLTSAGSYAVSGASCDIIIAENDFAYAGFHTGGVHLIDIDDPSSMSASDVLDYSETGTVLGLNRFDNYLIISRDTEDPVVFSSVSTMGALGSPTTTLEGVSIPTGLTLPGAIKKYKDKMVVVDFDTGLRKWVNYPSDCTDSLKTESVLYSNPVNGGVTGIKYCNFKAAEFYPGDDKDTITYWVKFGKTGSYDSLKINNNSQDPPPVPWGSGESWFDINYPPGPWNEIWWYGKLRDYHDVWVEGGVFYVDTVNLGYAISPSRSRPSYSVSIHVDFGAGRSTDLVFGLDSTATDRFDPALDVPFVISGSGPHAYFAMDTPGSAEDMGYSTYFTSPSVGTRLVRLILTESATLSWTVPTGMEAGDIVFDGIDLYTTTTLDLPAGEHTVIPNAGVGLYYKSDIPRGWTMTAPIASPLCETPSEVFGVNSSYIWSYDESLGGFYNPEKVEEGAGYFVLSTEPVMNNFHGVRNEWVRYNIHPGWNLIGGPTAGEVHVSSLITIPDSSLWVGPIYTIDDGGYTATEWLQPGVAYWAYANEEAVLYAEYEEGSRKDILLGDPDIEITLDVNNGSENTHLYLGIDSRATDEFDGRFDRLQPPPMPGMRNLAYLIGDDTPCGLSRDVRNTDLEWQFVLKQNSRIASNHRVKVIADEELFLIDGNGIELEPGIYKVVLGDQKLPSSLQLASRPNPFNAVVSVGFALPRDGLVNLSVYDMTGRKVSEIANGDMLKGRYTYRWDAKDANGRGLPAGIYFAKLVLDNGLSETRRMVLIK